MTDGHQAGIFPLFRTRDGSLWLLRNGLAADLGRILEIDEGRGPGAWTADAYRPYLESRPGELCLVVCRADQADLPLAFAVARLLVDELEILQIAVDKKMRRRGLGAILMEGLARRGREAKKEFWILEVRESNTAALALYRSFAFEEEGRRSGYYPDSGESAILMRGRLSFLGGNDKKEGGSPG